MAVQKAFSEDGWIATTALVPGIPDARNDIIIWAFSKTWHEQILVIIPHRTLGVSTTCISDIHRLLYVATEKDDCPASYMDPNLTIHLETIRIAMDRT